MARGPSGKLVVDIDPTLKDALHAKLAAEKKTVRQWVAARAAEYVAAGDGPSYVVRQPAELLAAAEQTLASRTGR